MATHTHTYHKKSNEMRINQMTIWYVRADCCAIAYFQLRYVEAFCLYGNTRCMTLVPIAFIEYSKSSWKSKVKKNYTQQQRYTHIAPGTASKNKNQPRQQNVYGVRTTNTKGRVATQIRIEVSLSQIVQCERVFFVCMPIWFFILVLFPAFPYFLSLLWM